MNCLAGRPQSTVDSLFGRLQAFADKLDDEEGRPIMKFLAAAKKALDAEVIAYP